jgi:DNA gyrase subunit A
MAYVLKVWRLPLSTPQGKGKALVNLLPLKQGEITTTVLPLPEKEAEWEGMDVMFATRSGDIRRNSLADFANVKSNGKIAMKIDDGDAIIGVQLCSVADDVLLTTRMGKCIRFSVDDVRVFKGRDSTGVRGIRLVEGDYVVSMAILRHVDATPPEARAYLKQAAIMRRATGQEEGVEPVEAPISDDVEDVAEETSLSPDRYANLGAAEQFVLTVSERGFGKRTSAFEYRLTGRGGSGIVAMAMSERNGSIVASFPVEDSDQIMLISDQGQTIRSPVADVRIAGRATQGVTLFRVSDTEKVVSVERIGEGEDLDTGGAGEGESA